MEFRPPSYFALVTLIDGPLHGYAIVRRAAELSDGQVRLSTGTLYALLDRAISEGLVVAGCAVRGERPGAARLHPHAEGTRRAPGRGTAARARRLGGHAPAERDRSGGSAMTRADAAKIALLAYPSP